MSRITKVHARQVFDSRGNPTIEAEVTLENNIKASSIVPSGASTGKHEAIELRDKDKNRYYGKGVKQAVSNIINLIKPEIIDKHFDNINDFDQKLIKCDGTKNKSKIGANAILALSLAFSKALAKSSKQNLYEFLSIDNSFLMPVPMMNIINGGTHANNNIDIQEFMIAPIGANTFSEALQYGCEIFQTLKSKCYKRCKSSCF